MGEVFDNMREVYLGIDLGATKMLAVLMDEDGRILAKEKRPTLPERGPDDVIGRLIDLGQSLMNETFPGEQGLHAVRGIGVAVAGVIEPESGAVSLATNLGWKNVELGRRLMERFPCRVLIMNDANAAALGEWKFGEGAGSDDMIYISVSTGIGAGMVSGGRLILGSTHSAAELGHISIDPEGPPCFCGNRGCVEMYTAGHSIAQKAREAIHQHLPGSSDILALAGSDPDLVTAEHVAAAAKIGNVLAVRLLAEAGTALGRGLVTLVHLMNPEVVVLGGSVSKSGPPLFEPMLETVRRYGIPGLVGHVRFAESSLGEKAAAMGAAFWCREHQHSLTAV